MKTTSKKLKYNVKTATYFKWTFAEKESLLTNPMSGTCLPDPGDGPFEFNGCEFHPRLEKAVTEYACNGSQFVSSRFGDNGGYARL